MSARVAQTCGNLSPRTRAHKKSETGPLLSAAMARGSGPIRNSRCTLRQRQQPGDVLGGTRRRFGGDAPAKRVPVGPPSLHPPGFSIRSSFNGRMLGTDRSESIYSYSGDTAESTSCLAECLAKWKPVLAPSLAREQGEWSLLERSPGERQWVFRGKPLYTYILDSGTWSQQGSDEPGWDNVFTQVADSYLPVSGHSTPWSETCWLIRRQNHLYLPLRRRFSGSVRLRPSHRNASLSAGHVRCGIRALP